MIRKIPDWKNLEMSRDQLNALAVTARSTCENIHSCFRCQCLIFGPLSYWTYETEEEKKFLVCEDCTNWLKHLVPEFTNYAKHHKK
tara:strand:- start:151 stop:408 length:258 start_codon:yes stop_codon:yes gene_type:complete